MDKTSLLSQWKEKKKSEAQPLSIGKAPDNTALPLSYSQRGLWFLQQLYPDNPFYNYAELYRFQGALQVDLLMEALQGVVDSHDILRTVYYEEDGQPFMRTISELRPEISHHDLRDDGDDTSEALRRIWDADAKKGFDLSRPPTIRVSIVRLKGGVFQLMLTLHHIATDKWSMNLLREEWAENYRSLVAGEAPEPRRPGIQFPDFAYWQRTREIKPDQLQYWKSKLGGELPMIGLPSDFPRPKKSAFIGRSSEEQALSKKTSERILLACKQLGVTPHTYFLAIYYLFLHRYTGQTDILIGSPISNRDRKELENTIGFFNDTVVLRTEFDRQATFSELLNAAKQTSLEAFSNKEIPFDVLVRELKQERSLAIHPFFQVMFLYYSASEPEFFGEELVMDSEFYNPGVSKFDLTFDVAEKNGVLSFAFEYSTELFRSETIQRFHDYMSLLIDGVLEEPNRQLSEINMIPALERQFLMPDTKKAKNPWEAFTAIHQVIEQTASAHPDAVAVSFMRTHLTYGELNRRAEALARKIFGKTKGNNSIIGLCAERSVEMVVGLLAILKAGCAYLPIDPKYPADRIRFMVEDADLGGLVTQQNLVPLFDTALDGIFLLDKENVKDTEETKV